MLVPVHAVLQGTLLPDIAARRARKVDVPGAAAAAEPLGDRRIE